MSLEHFPWLTDAVLTYKNLTFPSSIIIEGEAGLAKKELANFFAQKLICSSNSAPCSNCNCYN